LYFTSLEINAVNANIAYVTVAGFSAGNKVFKTINGGASWQNISYNLPNLPVNCIKSLPNGNSLIAACDVGVYQLDETQNTWINISVDIPNVIVSDIEINEAANKIYLSTFGRGIWQADLSVVSGMTRALTTANNFSILPNLNDGNFIISNKMADAICDIQIFDITGRVISQLQSTGIQTQVHLNAAPGKYFVKLQPAVGNAEVGSFVIQR
jgi:hypothetical protein